MGLPDRLRGKKLSDPVADKRPRRARPKLNVLSCGETLRPGEKTKSGFRTRRLSVDFVVDGRSLRDILDGRLRFKSDLMGCLVEGHPDYNARVRARLLAKRNPDSPAGRVLLYVCPECGDVGCGAYGVRIRRRGDRFVWSDFGFESFEKPIRISGVRFTFDARAYRDVVSAAATRFSVAPRARPQRRRAGR